MTVFIFYIKYYISLCMFISLFIIQISVCDIEICNMQWNKMLQAQPLIISSSDGSLLMFYTTSGVFKMIFKKYI